MNRPKHFSDIIGHDWLVKYFADHVQKGTLHQFLILHGPEGTGKTSLADLIALDLVYGVEDSPEKDAAYNNVIKTKRSNDYIKKFEMSIEGGKEEAKSVIGEMSTVFTKGRRKVIICDESHNFSDAGQDVLLSQSEFIPDGVYLILLTTDITRLKPALQSRALPIQIPALTQSAMVNILKKEAEARQLNIQAADATLSMIAEWANCRPRTGLQILNAFNTGDTVSAEDIRNLIGLTSSEDILPLVASLSGSMTYGLNYISEMVVSENIVSLVAEFIKLKSGEHSYKLKMNEVVKIKSALQDVSLEQLQMFLYGLTKHQTLTRRGIMNAYLRAHVNFRDLGMHDTTSALDVELGQRTSIVPEFTEEHGSNIPTLDELLANSDIVTD